MSDSMVMEQPLGGVGCQGTKRPVGQWVASQDAEVTEMTRVEVEKGRGLGNRVSTDGASTTAQITKQFKERKWQLESATGWHLVTYF